MYISEMTPKGRISLSLIVSAAMLITLPGTTARAGNSFGAGLVGGIIGGVVAVCATGGCKKKNSRPRRRSTTRTYREAPRRSYRNSTKRRSTTRKTRRSRPARNIVQAPTYSVAQVFQQQLQTMGFYAGRIDGNLSSLATRDAIIGYQLTYGLPQTGHLFAEERQILQEQASLRETRAYLENPVALSGAARNRKIQAGLKVYGMYDAKIDGKIGPISRKSIAAFQRQNGMIPTGRFVPQDLNYLVTSSLTVLNQIEQGYKTQLASIAQTRVSGTATAAAAPKNQPFAGNQLRPVESNALPTNGSMETNGSMGTSGTMATNGGIELSRPNVQPQLQISPADRSASQSGQSQPSVATVTRSGLKIVPISSPDESLAKKGRPDAVAIIIGNRDYVNQDIPDVEYAHRDADAMKKVFVEKFGVKLENIVDLRDATKSQIEQAFGTSDTIDETTLWSYVEPESDVYVFYSGHGMPTKSKGEAYILPVDADPNSPNISGYPLQRLYANLNKVKAKSITVFVEACFSGGSSKGMLIQSASPVFAQTNLNDLNTGNITVFTAARGTEIASWDEKAGHGLFTKVAIDGLNGLADEGRFGNGDGVVTAGELQSYLAKVVKRKAKRTFKRLQNPVLDGNTEQALAYLN